MADKVKAVSNVVSIGKKYTLQSTGIWELIRRTFAVDPNRSNGVPLNPQFRNPPPGDLDPRGYDDPVTVPAADIADNPYWKRDVRRNYPRLSTVKQADVVGLLTVGSAAAPKDDVLQIGDAGAKQLVEIHGQGEEKGLAAVFEQKGSAVAVLGEDGLPPLPVKLGQNAFKSKDWKLETDQSYGNDMEYPCRTFS